MAVVSVKELARKNVYEIGKPRVLTREFVVVLSDAVLSTPMAENVPFDALAIPDISTIAYPNEHPTYLGYFCRKVTYTEGYEGSPYHVHVLAEYGIVNGNELLTPVDRVPVWEFESSPGEVPALFYFQGSGNGTRFPLTNSAYDYFPGLVTQEAMVLARVTQNFASLPYAWIAAQNHVNDSVYLGCPIHSVKVASVSVRQTSEDFEGALETYWQATAELQYRQSGHNLQLPDIGFNFLAGQQKQRAMVFDFQNAEWVPSPNPVGLNGTGGLTGGAPAILDRRVNPVADFALLFGTPPTTPLT